MVKQGIVPKWVLKWEYTSLQMEA